MNQLVHTAHYLVRRLHCAIRQGHDFSWVTGLELRSRRPVCTRCGRVQAAHTIANVDLHDATPVPPRI